MGAVDVDALLADVLANFENIMLVGTAVLSVVVLLRAWYWVRVALRG